MPYRDLGGVRNMAGKTVKPGLLLRSANLSRAGRRTLSQLEKLSLYKIIDLRTDQEIAEKPDRPVPGAVQVHCPVFTERTVGVTREKNSGMRDMLRAMPDMEGLYRSMVTGPDSLSNLKRILDEILAADGRPVLFHCTAGKDRTGIVSWLLLSLLDVAQEEILRDYLSQRKKHNVKSLGLFCLTLLATGKVSLAAKVRRFYQLDEAYLSAAIEAVRERYGTTQAFLEEGLGISPARRQAFQRKILCD